MKKYTSNIIAGLLAIWLLLFVWHRFLMSGNSVILIMLLPVFYYFLKRVIEKENKRKFILSSIIAVVFATIEIICISINTDYTLNHILDKWTVLNFTGYAILAWSVISTIYTVIEENKLSVKNLKIGKLELLAESKWSFIINMILILLAWLPYFLRYYPGLLTADSCAQMAQAIGIAELSNHHPIFHTGIISLFVNLGKGVFGNINTGVVFYTIFQMIAMAIMFSIVLGYLSKRKAPLLVRIVALLYYMFYPIHALFGVTMWKDVLFAGMIPIYAIFSIELLFDTQDFLKNKKKIALYILISVLVMFLRNNGLYIVVLTLPFVIIVLRKYWKKMLVIACIIIVSYLTLKTVIFQALAIKERFCGRNAFDTTTTNSKSKEIS